MQIHSFENDFDRKILKRGYDYFVEGHVEDLYKTSATAWSALIEGSNKFYQVDIQINKSGTIFDTFCDCPYDDDCKHIVAALYAIKEEFIEANQPQLKAKSQTLAQTLKKQTKQQLLDIIHHICELHPHIKSELQLKLNPLDDDFTIAKKLINEHLSKAQDRSGFIDWDEVEDAMYGVDLVISEAEQALHSQQYLKALQLTLLCFDSALDAISYADDSSGAIGERIYESCYLLQGITEAGMVIWSTTEQEQTYQLIMTEIKKTLLNDWSDFKIELLKSCVPLCLNSEIEKQYSDYLKATKKYTHDDYTLSELLTLEHDVIALTQSTNAANDFLKQHTDNDKIRRHLIREYMFKKDYKNALQLAQEGFTTTTYLGYKCDYLKDQFAIYEVFEDYEALKIIGKDLLLEGYVEYYEKLKRLYSDTEWELEKEQLLDGLQQKRSYYYLELVVQEKHLPRLLSYCEENPQAIINKGAMLVDIYPQKVQQLFEQYIIQSAAAATSRNKYYNLTQYIKAFHNAGFEEQASSLTVQLLKMYPKRTAMHDEFQKHL